MPDSVFDQIRQHKINRDHALRLRAAERNLESAASDALQLTRQISLALTAIVDRLTEKQLLSADEAAALREQIPTIPEPVPSPAEALSAQTSAPSAAPPPPIAPAPVVANAPAPRPVVPEPVVPEPAGNEPVVNESALPEFSASEPALPPPTPDELEALTGNLVIIDDTEESEDNESDDVQPTAESA